MKISEPAKGVLESSEWCLADLRLFCVMDLDKAFCDLNQQEPEFNTPVHLPILVYE